MEKEDKNLLILVEQIHKNEQRSRIRLLVAILIAFGLGVFVTYSWISSAEERDAILTFEVFAPLEGDIIEGVSEMYGTFDGRIPKGYQLRIFAEQDSLYHPMVGQVMVDQSGRWSYPDLVVGISGKIKILMCYVKDAVGKEIDDKAELEQYDAYKNSLPDGTVILKVINVYKK